MIDNVRSQQEKDQIARRQLVIAARAVELVPRKCANQECPSKPWRCLPDSPRIFCSLRCEQDVDPKAAKRYSKSITRSLQRPAKYSIDKTVAQLELERREHLQRVGIPDREKNRPKPKIMPVRDQQWLDAVAKANMIRTGVLAGKRLRWRDRMQIADIALSVCKVQRGGDQYDESAKTLKAFSQAIGVHFNSLYGWIAKKRKLAELAA